MSGVYLIMGVEKELYDGVVADYDERSGNFLFDRGR